MTDLIRLHEKLSALSAATDPSHIRGWLAGQLSPETRRAYAADLRAFQVWAAERGAHSLAEITRNLLITYRDDLQVNGYAVSTIARKLSCVRQALGYAHAEGLITSNPAATVKTFRVPDVSPRHALDNPAARALLAQPDPSTVKGARDYALLALLLYLGLRRSEVVQLTCGQIGEERGHKTLRVLGKGGKVRLLPLPPQVMEAIHAYLERDGRPDAFTSAPLTALFRPVKNPRYGILDKPLSADGLWRMVKRYAHAAGLDPFDVHTLRHTALTAALDGGASLRRVQAMAGHADPKTTARYDSRRGDLDDSAVYRVKYA